MLRVCGDLDKRVLARKNNGAAVHRVKPIQDNNGSIPRIDWTSPYTHITASQAVKNPLNTGFEKSNVVNSGATCENSAIVLGLGPARAGRRQVRAS